MTARWSSTTICQLMVVVGEAKQASRVTRKDHLTTPFNHVRSEVSGGAGSPPSSGVAPQTKVRPDRHGNGEEPQDPPDRRQTRCHRLSGCGPDEGAEVEAVHGVTHRQRIETEPVAETPGEVAQGAQSGRQKTLAFRQERWVLQDGEEPGHKRSRHDGGSQCRAPEVDLEVAPPPEGDRDRHQQDGRGV